MSVARVTELSCTSTESFEDAIRQGIDRATKTLRQVRSAWVDEQGRLFLDSPLGLGIVHTQDMHDAARAVEAGLWQPAPMPFAEMARHFGHVLSPAAAR